MKNKLMALTVALLLSGCANIPEGAGSNPNDPWERMNRHTTVFNDTLDAYVAEPVARGYRDIVPECVRNGVSNVFANLGEPANAVNNALQGKGKRFAASIYRFIINTVFGLGGVFDVADKFGGVKAAREDFGQTLGVWGVPAGPYLVLPMFGPSTLRDAPAKVVDGVLKPENYEYIVNSDVAISAITVTDFVDTRARLLPATDLLKEAVDPYVMAREGYLASRRNDIYDGEPPLELMKDEFEDEEEIKK